MAENKSNQEEKKAWRFYRSSLSTVVWDPDNDRPLADFTEGHFTTEDPRVAAKLTSLGYMEIPLDSTEPPPNIIIREIVPTIDGDIPVIAAAAAADPAKIEARMQNALDQAKNPQEGQAKAPRVRIRSQT
jgi:hypothetical protein